MFYSQEMGITFFSSKSVNFLKSFLESWLSFIWIISETIFFYLSNINVSVVAYKKFIQLKKLERNKKYYKESLINVLNHIKQ